MSKKDIISQEALDIPENEIPWYRWRCFLILTFLLFSPATLIIGFSGNVYGKKVFGKNKGQVFKLPNQNKNMLLVGTILIMVVNSARFFY